MRLGESSLETQNPPGTERREEAFHDIVKRHAGLVYATALRQTGNKPLAEEIMQNVFLALARKGADSMQKGATLSAWLYRATLLETKQCVRTELRRQRREQTAAELGTTHAQPEDSVWEPLIPMLDEAIMSLKEPDRVAVILRFFEDKPLKEVGMALGVSDDTVQKRIARCLEDLTRFFRRRGFMVPALTVSVPLLKSTLDAAPAALAGGLVQAMMKQGVVLGTSGASAWFATLISMSPIKTAILCSTAALLPVTWQWNQISQLNSAQKTIAQQVVMAEAGLDTANKVVLDNQSRLQLIESNLSIVRGKIHSATNSPLLTPASQDVVIWSESSDYVRVPKRILQNLYVKATKLTNGVYSVTDEMQTVLCLTPAETHSIEIIIAQAQERLNELESSHITPSSNHVTSASTGGTIDKISYRITPFEKEGEALHDELRNNLRIALGTQRENMLWSDLGVDLIERFRRFGSENKLVTLCLTEREQADAKWPEALAQATETYSEDGSIMGCSAGPCRNLSTIPQFLMPKMEEWKQRVAAMSQTHKK